MHPIKYIWALRAMFCKITFKNVGNMTYIGKPCFIESRKNISIGDKTRIFPGVRLESIGTGTISIGDNCAIEQNVHIISKDDNLIIGNDTTISSNVFISNVNHDYSDVNMSVMNQRTICKKTTISDGCFIGCGAVILPGTVLGKHCVVGSNSVVNGIFEDNCVIAGVPAKIIKEYCPKERKWIRK